MSAGDLLTIDFTIQRNAGSYQNEACNDMFGMCTTDPSGKPMRIDRLPSCPYPSAIPKLDHKHGTTTLGIRVRGAIVMAVDSRASQGQYIASQTVQKVLEINDFMLGTMAGGAADCQFWYRVLGQYCRLWELRHGHRITIAAASKYLSNITYQYRNRGLSMGTMIAGYDNSGPHLFFVDDKGNRIEHDAFSVGSGSVYAYGVLDAGYKFEMSHDDAVDLARRAIYHATHRDAFSGGFVSVYLITEKGWTKVSRDDQTTLHRSYGLPSSAAHGI